MGELMLFSIFMASITRSFCPACTFSPSLTNTFTIMPGMGAQTDPGLLLGLLAIGVVGIGLVEPIACCCCN